MGSMKPMPSPPFGSDRAGAASAAADFLSDAAIGDAVLLVGSWAHGHAGAASDLDIALLVRPETDEAEWHELVAAQQIRAEYPEVGVLVLSQYVEPSYAMRLLEEHPERVGYLLKERVFDVAILVDALRRLADGETVIDPSIVSRLVGRRRREDPLEALTEREQEVLGLVAEGLSNKAIAGRLFVTERTVEAHVKQIFLKLRLETNPESHRRVLAVLAYLRAAA